MGSARSCLTLGACARPLAFAATTQATPIDRRVVPWTLPSFLAPAWTLTAVADGTLDPTDGAMCPYYTSFGFASATVGYPGYPYDSPIVSPRSPALSYERMQVFIQQSEDRASVYQARALSEQNLFTEKRELEEHYHVRWREAMEGLYSETNVQVDQQLSYFEAEQRQYYHGK